MEKRNKESFFGTSYSDLTTSLFFIILVLFVLCLVIVHQNNLKLQKALEGANATIEEQKRLLRIDEQFKPLIESDIFSYKSDSRKFVVKDFIGKEIFSPNKDEILPEYKENAIIIGRELEKLLKDLSENNPISSINWLLKGMSQTNMIIRYPKMAFTDMNSAIKEHYLYTFFGQ